MRKFKNEKGFSVTEVMVALVIVGVLATVAIAAITKTVQAYRLDTGSAAMARMLADARMNAIKRNRTIVLNITRTSGQAVMQGINTNGTRFNVGTPETLPSGVVLDTTAASVEVGFDSMGRYTSGVQSFTIKEANLSKRKDITVSPAGKVTIGAIY